MSPPNPSTYSPAGAMITVTSASGPVVLACTGATLTATMDNSSANGDDTIALSNCSLAGLAPLTATLAMPPSTFLTMLPIPFAAAALDTRNHASQVSYTLSGQTTVLGIQGTMRADCLAGSGYCAMLRQTPRSLTFSATAGGTAPPSQNLKIAEAGKKTSFFVTTASGGNWLSATPDFGQTGGSISVSANPSGLAAGTYHGIVTVYGAASNSPHKVRVTLNVTP